MSEITRTPIIIPGLPSSIAVVPRAPSSPDEIIADLLREEWMEWRNDVMRHRIERRHTIRENPELIPLEMQKCANHPAYLASTWLSILEPRRRKVGTGSIPFVPFEKQVFVIDELLRSLSMEDQHADVVWSKCRGWGATWIGCLIALWGWLFSYIWGEHSPVTRGPWFMLMLSAKEELVDSKKQKSIFAKIDRLLRSTPPWMMPKGFDWMQHRMKLSLMNPENDNEIVGESTTIKSGRGDRSTAVWVDECAAIPDFLETWATLGETTDHRWGASTESSLESDDFRKLRTGRAETGITPLFLESDWWENPTLDNAWLERERLRYDIEPGKFDREILRDPEGGMNQVWVYTKARDLHPDENVKIMPARQTQIWIDPGMADTHVLVLIQLNENGGPDILDSYATKGQPADYYVPLLKPSLFGKEFSLESMEWTPTAPGALPETYFYGPREMEFAANVIACAADPVYIGDTYGSNVMGATADSVYSRWERYGIFVNKDRRSGEGLSAFANQARTVPGRQQALRERLPQFRFAMTVGAIQVLQSIQNFRFKRSDKPTTSPVIHRLHDEHSHYATACEFGAVFLRQSADMGRRTLSKPVKSRMGINSRNFGNSRKNLREIQWTE